MSATSSAQNAAESGAVRAALERVLARPEFRPERHPLRDRFDRLVDDVVKWISGFFGVSPEAAQRIFAWAFYILLALLAAALIVGIVRTAARAMHRAAARVEDGASQADVRAARAAELRAKGRAAEAHGEHALALRLYFWALVVGLGERGGLEYRDAWTNRELLERGAPAPEVARVLRPLVPELDRKIFGREGAAADDVARLSKLCDEMLGAQA